MIKDAEALSQLHTEIRKTIPNLVGMSNLGPIAYDNPWQHSNDTAMFLRVGADLWHLDWETVATPDEISAVTEALSR